AEADVAPARQTRLAGVETHADANRRAVAPGVRGERPLCRNGGRDRVSRTFERDEEGVSLRIDLDPAVLREATPKKATMLGKHVAVLLAQPLDEIGGAVDVGEEKGDCSVRQLGHWN